MNRAGLSLSTCRLLGIKPEVKFMSDPAIRIGLVTLGVEDLARASAFYEAMGAEAISRVSGDNPFL